MSSFKKEFNLKPSDIVKANNAKTQEEKEEEEQARRELGQRIQIIIDNMKKNRESNILLMEKNNKDTSNNQLCIEEMNSEQLKEIFPDYDENINYPEKKEKVDCKGIHGMLQTIFDKYINELYKSFATKDRWDENIRDFINYHENMNIDIDTSSYLSNDEIDEINEQGFHFFVGDKCANVDEDEIDGKYDLSIDEWEKVDDIILFYYHKFSILEPLHVQDDKQDVQT